MSMPTTKNDGAPDLEKESLLELARRSIDPEVIELIKQVDAAVFEEPESEPKFFTTPMGACHAGAGLDSR